MDEWDEEFNKFLHDDSEDGDSPVITSKKKGNSERSIVSTASSLTRKTSEYTRQGTAALHNRTTTSSLDLSSWTNELTSPLGQSEDLPSYASGREGFDASVDPYNFDLGPSIDFNQIKKKKDAKKQPKSQHQPSKRSVEERMADILKRTGSNLADDFVAKIEKGADATAQLLEEADKAIAHINEDTEKIEAAEGDVQMLDDSKDDALNVEEKKKKDLNLNESFEDSLEMNSEDFEVGAYARKKQEQLKEERIARALLLSSRDNKIQSVITEQQMEEKDIKSARSSTNFDPGSATVSGFALNVDRNDFAEAGHRESKFRSMQDIFSLPADEDFLDPPAPQKTKSDSSVAIADVPTKEAVTQPIALVEGMDDKDVDEYSDDEFENESPVKPYQDSTDLPIFGSDKIAAMLRELDIKSLAEKHQRPEVVTGETMKDLAVAAESTLIEKDLEPPQIPKDNYSITANVGLEDQKPIPTMLEHHHPSTLPLRETSLAFQPPSSLDTQPMRESGSLTDHIENTSRSWQAKAVPVAFDFDDDERPLPPPLGPPPPLMLDPPPPPPPTLDEEEEEEERNYEEENRGRQQKEKGNIIQGVVQSQVKNTTTTSAVTKQFKFDIPTVPPLMTNFHQGKRVVQPKLLGGEEKKPLKKDVQTKAKSHPIEFVSGVDLTVKFLELQAEVATLRMSSELQKRTPTSSAISTKTKSTINDDEGMKKKRHHSKSTWPQDDDDKQSKDAKPTVNKQLDVHQIENEAHELKVSLQQVSAQALSFSDKEDEISKLHAEFTQKEKKYLQQLKQSKDAILELEDRVFTLQKNLSEQKPTVHGSILDGIIEGDLTGTGPKIIAMQESQLFEIEKEVQIQDTLLKGFQRENEKLSEHMMDLKGKRNVMRENEILNETVARQKQEISLLKNEAEKAQHADTKYHELVQARFNAEARNRLLEDELYEKQQMYQQKEQELQQQINRLRDDKKALECQFANVDMQQVDEDQVAYKRLEKQLERERASRSEEVESLKSKLDWYVKNQALIDSKDHLLKKQEEELSTLRLRLDSHDSTLLKKGPPRHLRSTTMDIRRIQDLEKQLEQMEEACRKRNPDSIVSLIRATKPSAEENELVVHWKSVAEEREEEIRTIHDGYERNLTLLRQQHDKMVAQLKEKMDKMLESQADELPREKDLHKEIDRLHAYYSKKIKELEKRSTRRFLKDEEDDKIASSTGHSMQEEVHRLNQLLRRKNEKIKALESNENVGDDVESNQIKVQSLAREMMSLKKQLASSEEARAKLVETLSMVQMPAQSAVHKEALQKPIMDLENQRVQMKKKSHEDKDAQTQTDDVPAQRLNHELGQENCVEVAKARTAEIIQQMTEENTRLSDRLQQVLKNLSDTQSIADMVPILEQEVATLRKECAIPKTPSMLQFQKLEASLEFMQQKQEQREKILQDLLDEARQTSAFEKWKIKRECEVRLSAKNEEVEAFRNEVGALMKQLESLQSRGTDTP